MAQALHAQALSRSTDVAAALRRYLTRPGDTAQIRVFVVRILSGTESVRQM